MPSSSSSHMLLPWVLVMSSFHISIVLSFDVSVVALWGSLVVICHCAVLSSSLSWPCWVCAGAGCSSLLVHGGGGLCRCLSVVVVGPHCCLCHCVVCPSLPCHSQQHGTWALVGEVAVCCGVHGG